MSLVGFTFSRHRLKFRRPFGISKLMRTHQEVMRVRLQRDGIVGWGETPAISYYGKTVDGFLEKMKAIEKQLQAASWESPHEFYQVLVNFLPNQSFLRAALDAAAWDWYGQKKQKAVWELLDLSNPIDATASNYTIGLASPEEMLANIQDIPWPIYKLKLGGPQDQACLTAICAAHKNPLRIDANGAWSASETQAFVSACEAIAPGQVELIEEPFKEQNTQELVSIAQESSIPFFADESFQNKSHLARLREVFQGINLKLDKCGGLTPAVEIIKLARQLDYQIQLGCMSSSGMALAPAIQLSAAAEVIDLDTVLLVEGDDFGVHYVEGVARVSGGVGLGLTL